MNNPVKDDELNKVAGGKTVRTSDGRNLILLK